MALKFEPTAEEDAALDDLVNRAGLFTAVEALHQSAVAGIELRRKLAAYIATIRGRAANHPATSMAHTYRFVADELGKLLGG